MAFSTVSKNFSIFKLSEIWSKIFVPDPELFPTKIPDPGAKKNQIPDPQHYRTLTDGWAGKDGSLPGEGEAGNVAGVVAELGEKVSVGNVPDEDPQVPRPASQETTVRREGHAQNGRSGKLFNYISWVDLVAVMQFLGRKKLQGNNKCFFVHKSGRT